MYVIFNGINSGLGNNGGSRTMLLSQKALEESGHTCDVVASVDNFKWFKHKSVVNYIPNDADAIINIAAVDYNTTKQSNIGIKAAWWRGHEIWSNSVEYLKYCYTDNSVNNFVNSKGLQKLFESYGAESKVVYQGVDFECWEDLNLRHNTNKIRIGCLYNKKPTKKWDSFVKLSSILGTDDYEYIGIGDTFRDDPFLTEFKANATSEELKNIYSSCHIFFLPTVLEGLHNIGIEASLCGCLLVGNNNPNNGMVNDYLFDNKTGMVYEDDNIDMAAELIRNPKWELVTEMQRYIKDNIGTRQENMSRFVSYLEQC